MHLKTGKKQTSLTHTKCSLTNAIVILVLEVGEETGHGTNYSG